MKKLILLLGLTLMSCQVFAQGIEVSKIEKPDMICAGEVDFLLINLTQKRVWQATLENDEIGFELIVDKFSTMRCPNCYEIIAAEKRIKLVIKGVPGDLNQATLETIYDGESALNMNCKVKMVSR